MVQLAEKTQLDRIEDLLTQLISNVASNRSDLADFRKEVNMRLDRMEAAQALTDKRLNSHRRQIAELREEVDVLEQGEQ